MLRIIKDNVSEEGVDLIHHCYRSRVTPVQCKRDLSFLLLTRKQLQQCSKEMLPCFDLCFITSSFHVPRELLRKICTAVAVAYESGFQKIPILCISDVLFYGKCNFSIRSRFFVHIIHSKILVYVQ